MTSKTYSTDLHTGLQRLRAVLLTLTVLTVALSIPTVVSANDTKDDTSNANGGFLELGLVIDGQQAARHKLDPEESDDTSLGIGLVVNAGYRFGRVFFEATESGYTGLNAGITLAETDHWTFDLLLANIAGNVTIESDEPPEPTTEQERNEAILDRDSLFIAAGGRLTGHYGDNIIQLRLLSDWYDGNGEFGSVSVGRQWQIGNWNTQLSASARYLTSEFSDYQYGVDTDEQSERFTAYEAGSAWIPEIEAAARVPIYKDWVYSTRVRYRALPDSITDSPLINRSESISFSTGVYYVF